LEGKSIIARISMTHYLGGFFNPPPFKEVGEKKLNQSVAEGELTSNSHDKHPYRRKVQRTKAEERFLGRRVEPVRLQARLSPSGKVLNIFPVRERRKGLPLSERNQVTIGEYVYKRSRSLYSPLCGKWHKYRKGENIIIETVASPPIESTV